MKAASPSTRARWLALVVAIAGCGGAKVDPGAPVPALATTPGASRAFGDLRRRWAGATRQERLELEGYITSLRELYANEPVASVAEVYLAWIALEKGDFEQARALAKAAGGPHPGNVRDLSQLVDGATLVRSGEFHAALSTLEPLLGKLLDPYARELLHEEAVVAAVAASRWSDTIRLLDVWLRDAPDDDLSTVLEIARELLKQVPTQSLEQALEQIRQDTLNNGNSAVHSEALEKAIVRRLGTIAIARQDSSMARRLLANEGTLSQLGESGDQVMELASHFDVPQVNGRRIGLLLPAESPLDRARSADASRGALWALEKLGMTPQQMSNRLLVRNEGPTLAETSKAIAALDAEGAAVLIGGFDAERAKLIAELAEERGIAVLLLTPPAKRPTNARWPFFFGPAAEAAQAPLLDALGERGATVVVPVGSTIALLSTGRARALSSLDCVPFAASLSPHRYPTADWKKQHVDGVLLVGEERCAEDVLDEVRAASLDPLVGLGPTAASLVLPPSSDASPARKAPKHALVATLGCFPVDTQGKPSDELLAFTATHGGPPSYWTVLTREATLLAAHAIEDLPTDQTMEAMEVARRRAQARAALVEAPSSPCMGLRPSIEAQSMAWRIVETGQR